MREIPALRRSRPLKTGEDQSDTRKLFVNGEPDFRN